MWIGGTLVALTGLCIMSLEHVGALALRSFDTAQPRARGDERAIVVITGSRKRVVTAVSLQRFSNLPIRVIGAGAEPYMRDLAAFGGHGSLVETESVSTRENAAMGGCKLVLQGEGSVFLVTDSWHMQRASKWFQLHGMQVTPIVSEPALRPPDRERTRPTWHGLKMATTAIHEGGGLVHVTLADALQLVTPCAAAEKTQLTRPQGVQ
ncbi:MAG TPA: ElyC/SanA/YdcF family protein [Ramlibacter sp.]|jgi:uncharacterized SAM-binding protein YcdF (DUF218 family)